VDTNKIEPCDLLVLTLNDGCKLTIKVSSSPSNGWIVNFPQGIEVRCPHGCSANIGTPTTNEQPSVSIGHRKEKRHLKVIYI